MPFEIDCRYSSPEELSTILSKIPENTPVIVTKGNILGVNRDMPIGKLRLHSKQGGWGASFFWTDGTYGEYVWLQPKFDTHMKDPVVSIKVV